MSEELDGLLVRYLDGALAGRELERLNEWLRVDAAARARLREMSEQAVVVADVERTAGGVPAGPGTVSGSGTVVRPVWAWVAGAGIAAALAVGLVVWGPEWRGGGGEVAGAGSDEELVRVSMVTGANRVFAADGKLKDGVAAGSVLGAGDTLETKSCDAWTELALADGGQVTIAGHSYLRVLEGEDGAKGLSLEQGNLWARVPSGGVLALRTPTMAMDVHGGQFDVQAYGPWAIVRVNEGLVRVRPARGGEALEVRAGEQVEVSLESGGEPAVVAQPTPSSRWDGRLEEVPDVLLGKWLPQLAGEEGVRLGAEPLLWEVADRDPLMLYAVALSAWGAQKEPVLLQSGAKLLVRGRTRDAVPVRFGFSAQKMRGVFAGKFETDVAAAQLGAAGEPWEVELPLARFRALHGHLAEVPDGLELKDVYALTVGVEAGLEISAVELLPAGAP